MLKNGSFETGDLTGWTSAHKGIASVWSGAPSTFNPAALDTVSGAEDGKYYLLDGTFGDTATYSQTFGDVAGAAYTVKVWYASNGGSPSRQYLAINGIVLGQNNPALEEGWRLFTTHFIGTGSDTLTLGSRNDPHGNFFDNVSVSGPGVPEPAAWSLMIVGLGLAGGALRRRRIALPA